ncbi:MAG TPA: hypothetical protein VF209_03630 [Patescibacteria group bacterium]
MFDRESIFYKRNSQGDVVINLNLSAFKYLGWWVILTLIARPFVSTINLLHSSINVVTNHRPLLFVLSGLGLGFGMGLVIFQRPMTTLASPFPVYAQQSAITIKEVSLADVSFSVALPDKEKTEVTDIRHLTTSATLSQNGTIVLKVGGLSQAKNYLENVSLNDPIALLGSNNGRYTYQVIEIKEVDNETLPTLFSQNGKALLLYTPVNVLQTKYLVVIAK